MAKEDAEPKQSKGRNRKALQPLRVKLTSLGVGLGWAALHMPTISGLDPSLVAWVLDALIATLLANAALEMGLATLAWFGRAWQSLWTGD